MQNARGRGDTHVSKWPAPTPESLANIRPERATGRGTYLSRVANAFSPGPHGYRGDGRVCCRPAGERFDRRAQGALRGKK